MKEVLVCVALAGQMVEVLNAVRQAAELGADLVELRLDLMPGFDLETLLRGRPLPVIVTYRPKRAGGAYIGSEEERLATLRRAMALGAEYVDVEPDVVHHLRGYGSAKIIVSHHEFGATSPPLRRMYDHLAATGADIIKVAVMAERIESNLAVFDLLRTSDRPTIALAMGEAGVISRILAGRYNSFLTFAALDGTAPVAPGQIGLSDMLYLYRVREISANTELYGVMANPVGHSMSPVIHNAAFKESGLDAVYLPLLVQEPVSFLRAFTPLGFKGYSVTIPHKQAVLVALDEVEPLAARIGAVNTVIAHNGRLLGYNTDVEGAIRSIEEALPEGMSLAGSRALLIGAGGLARALAYGLTGKGVQLTIANRNIERARALAAEVGADYCSLADMPGVQVDLLLQTTSVGMYPNVDESIVPAGILRPGLVVYDAVYNPLETRLLREAAAAGCITVSGLGHFINQAARQFELWTGMAAPRQVMREAILQRLAH
ncbi:MAG: shikimate dehydrogenase [Anaerolineae bacterium]